MMMMLCGMLHVHYFSCGDEQRAWAMYGGSYVRSDQSINKEP